MTVLLQHLYHIQKDKDGLLGHKDVFQRNYVPFFFSGFLASKV